MAVTAERLLVKVESRGSDAVERGLDGVTRSAVGMARAVANAGDSLDDMARSAAGALSPLQAIRSTADSVGDNMAQVARSSGRAGRGLTTVAGAAVGVVGPLSLLNSRLDETDSDLKEVRNSATGASGALNTYSGSSLGAAAASYTMHDAIIAGAVPSLIVLLSTLGPLVGTVGALTAGLLGLAGGFGVVLGTGALAWFETTEDAMGQLQQVLDELIAIGTEFGMQFVPLIDAAINAVPELAQRLVDATGDMTPFVNELQRLGSAAMEVLPRVLGWFMDIGREALPIWRDFTNWIGTRTPDALAFFRSVVSRTWDSLHSLSLALLDALATFTEFGVVATNVVAPMLERILGGFEDLLNWVMDLPEPFRRLTVAAAALAPVFTVGAVAAGELMRIISGLSGTFTRSNSIIGRVTPSLAGMARILGVVGAAALALNRAYQTNFAGIRDSVDRVVAAARDEFLPTWRLAKEVIGPILSDLAGMFTLTGDRAESALGRIVTMVADQLVAAIRTAGPIIREQLRALDTWWAQHGETVTSTITDVVWAIQNTLVAAINTVVPILRDLGLEFLSMRGDARQALLDVGIAAGTWLAGAVQEAAVTVQGWLSQMQTWWAEHGTTVQAKIRGIATTIRAGLATAIQTARSIFSQLVSTFQTVRGVAQSLIDRYVTMDNIVFTLAATVGGLAASVVGLFNPFSSATSAGFRFVGMLRLVPGVIGTVIGAIGSVISTLGSMGLSGVILRVVGLIPTLVGAFSSVGGAALALSGPIGVAIGVSAALFAAWQTNFLGIRDLTDRVLAGIRTTMQGDMSAIRSTVDIATRAINTAWHDYILPLWEVTKQVFGEIQRIVGNVMTWMWRQAIQPALAGISDLYNTHGEELVNEIRETYEAIKGYIEPALTFLKTIIGGFLVTTNEAWSKWGDEIMSVVNFTMDLIGNIIKVGADFLITTILVALNIIQGDWTEAWEEIKGFFSRTLTEIIDFAKKWGGRLLDWLGELVGNIIGWFEDLYHDLIGGSVIPEMLSSIMSALEGFGEDALDWLSGMVSDFIEDVEEWGEKALSAVEEFIDNILNDALDVTQKFKDAGGDLISAFADGISGAVGEATDAVDSVVDSVSSYLPGSDAEVGPLSTLTDMGEALPETLAKHIFHNLRGLREAASAAAEAAHPEVGQIQPDILPPEAFGAMSSAGGGGVGDIYVEVDARGSENPRETRRQARRGGREGAYKALDAANVSRQ